jgi:Biotin-(acetyl-CoA carboxylase) ligase
MAMALSIRRVLEQGFGLPAAVKWPNDVLIRGRKVAGILAEAGQTPPHVVILGFGVNTASKDEFEAFLAQVIKGDPGRKPLMEPTSVAIEADREVLPEGLLKEILREFEARYLALLAQDGEPSFLEEWRAYDTVLGSDVTVNLVGDRHVNGRAIDVTGEGALLVNTPDRGPIKVMAGDVWVRPEATKRPRGGGDAWS